MRLITTERLDPKRAFPCARCDPPPKVARVYRRYRFTLLEEGPAGRRGQYCLPCAARSLARTQGSLRHEADEGAASSVRLVAEEAPWQPR